MKKINLVLFEDGGYSLIENDLLKTIDKEIIVATKKIKDKIYSQEELKKLVTKMQ